jgi:Uma2 family endonuclease
MTALLKKDVEYTLEDYIELEKNSEEKFEFYDGAVWSMAGASAKHEEISINLSTALKNALRGRGCRIFGSNLRVKVPIYPPYRYPDLVALCGQPIYENLLGLEMLINPTLIVEVLSPSTEVFDLNDKFTYYKSIESFTEYLLIDQDRPHVILYTKQAENVWIQREYNSLADTVYLTSLEGEILLTDIYENIEFTNLDRPRFPIGLEREDR